MKKIPLEPGRYYHVFNHANGFENFFYDANDYRNFLYRYNNYIVPIADTFAFCLMPNHFHFFVRIKLENDLTETLQVPLSKSIIYRFSHFFNSYAQSYNKKYHRKGSIFKSNFQRKQVNTEKYFLKLVHYIHSNPVVGGLVENIHQWEFSSYPLILLENDSFLDRKLVLDFYGSKENFIFVHANPLTLQGS